MNLLKTLHFRLRYFYLNKVNIELITSLDFDYVFENKPELNLTFGLGNRWGDALIYSVGTKLNEFEFGFSYDYNISSLSKASNNDGGLNNTALHLGY